MVKSAANWVFDKRAEDARIAYKLLKEERLKQVELNSFRILEILKKPTNDQNGVMKLMIRREDHLEKLFLESNQQASMEEEDEETGKPKGSSWW